MENKTFTFEDIMLLDDLSLRRVMGRVESEHLENAFIGADAGIVAKACNNMSLFARDGLSRMLQTSGAEVSQSSIESSREKIANIITWFAGEGRILSPDSWRVPAKSGVIRQIEEAMQTGRLDLYNWYCRKNALSGFEEVVKSAFDSFKDRKKELSAITALKIKGEILYSAELLYNLNSLEHLVVDYEDHLCSDTLPPAMLSKLIGECKNLKSLVFSTPYLELPEWIFGFTSLTDLCLRGTYHSRNANPILLDLFDNPLFAPVFKVNYSTN